MIERALGRILALLAHPKAGKPQRPAGFLAFPRGVRANARRAVGRGLWAEMWETSQARNPIRPKSGKRATGRYVTLAVRLSE